MQGWFSQGREIPKAVVQLKEIKGRCVWILNGCPYCGKKHTHDAGPDKEKVKEHLGSRLAHCEIGGDWAEYELVRQDCNPRRFAALRGPENIYGSESNITFAVGAASEGYRGMDEPSVLLTVYRGNDIIVEYAMATSQAEPFAERIAHVLNCGRLHTQP
jgi:hypothetical protein